VTKSKILNLSEWLPIPIDTIKKSLIFDAKDVVKKDIAYNLQYMQYIAKQIEELQNTSVITKMLYKNYIVVGMSIVEAIFYSLLKEKDLLAKDCWKKEKELISNEVDFDNARKRIVSELQIKVDNYEKKVNLSYLIDRAKSKKVIDYNTNKFDIFNNFRLLRNKIHIYSSDSSSNSDYNQFCEKDYYRMACIMYLVLKDKNVTVNNEYLEDMFNYLKEYLKNIKLKNDKI